MLFCIEQKCLKTYLLTFLKIIFIHFFTESSTNNVPTSQVRNSAMLALLIVGNFNYRLMLHLLA